MKQLATFRRAVLAALLSLYLVLPQVAKAQAPPWVLARINTLLGGGNRSTLSAVASDAAGNMLVAGYYTGQVAFGGTTLTSQGQADLFVAKYVPATNTWAWAMSGGGLLDDRATGIAVSGSSIYVVGALNNSRADDNAVLLATSSNGTSYVAQPGIGPTIGTDLLVAKYQDAGTSATLSWVQVAGGNSFDYGTAIAASGNQVYVTGYVSNSTTNAQQVLFGGSGTTAGTVVQAGASATTSPDLVLAKYQDNGTSATVQWTQVAGGTVADAGLALAVSNSNVYVTGYLNNDRTNTKAVVFGGAGTTPGALTQAGTSATASYDLFVAKYLDQGSSASVAWTQVGGGTDDDYGQALAVSGTSVYVAGSITNDRANTNGVVFGGTGLSAGNRAQVGASATSSADALLAKYLDQGTTASVVWTQAAGGQGADAAAAVVTAGSSVYVALSVTNDAANSQGVVLDGSTPGGGTVVQPGASATTSTDVVLARYADLGTAAAVGWAQVGGGANVDVPTSCALLGTRLYVGGLATPPAAFGSIALSNTSAFRVGNYLLAAVDLTNFLATTAGIAALPLYVYPNPAAGPVQLTGAAPVTFGQVLDALGRPVATFRTDLTGAATLPAGLPPGLYSVRVGQQAGRLAVP